MRSNKHRLWIFIVILVFVLVPSSQLFASIPSIQPFNVRALGMGSADTAVADDWFLLYNNPAGLTLERKYQNLEGQWMIAYELGTSFGQEFFDFADFMSKNASKFEDFENFDQNLQKSVRDTLEKFIGNSFGIGFSPLYLSFMLGGGNWNIGVAMYGVNKNSFSLRNYEIPEAYLFTGTRAGVITGVSMNTEFFTTIDLHVGIAVKLFAGNHYAARKAIYDIASIGGEITENFINNWGFGIGFDIGLLYEIISSVRVGLVFNDVYTIITNQVSIIDETKNLDQPEEEVVRVQPNISFGAALIMDFIPVPEFIMGAPILSFELSDMLDTDISPILWMNFGLEVPMFNVTGDNYILVLRGGIDSGYFVGGCSIGLWYVDINYAFSQIEAGIYPGQLPEKNHYISITMRF